MKSSRRVDVKGILADPIKRRELMVKTIIATQAREGVVTTVEQAEAAYDKIQVEKQRVLNATDVAKQQEK
jgi:hypothetical protein